MTRPSPLATVVIDVKSLAQEMSNTDVSVTQYILSLSHAFHITIAIPVRKCEKPSIKAMAPEKRRLNTATEATIANGEDFGCYKSCRVFASVTRSKSGLRSIAARNEDNVMRL